MRAFIFDMDGVIVDTQGMHTAATTKALNEFGVPVTQEEIQKYAGTANGLAYRESVKKYRVEIPIREVIARKSALFHAMLDEAIDSGRLQPIEGIPELLAQLNEQHIPTAIASSSSKEMIHHIVDTFHLRDSFAALITGRDLPMSKPDPAVYTWTAGYLKTPPRDCVVLEDAHMGVRAAKAAGMTCIGFQNPTSGNQDLSQADFIVHKISEIDIGRL
ncbi:HAD family hydrolase [Selenomonas sp. TAMA-11512]|uniref:HAD family hydrolase n=1 Tax=Selenomonas sp. TAMA-11512 TaxID=3095337 RepID=UPI003091F440|nr:HAD family hydrolase [Selenomonas sp. TAMA-11512]